MHKRFSFDKTYRLVHFQDCFECNQKVLNKSTVVYFKPDTALTFGFIVSRKTEKLATRRNKLKRRLREVIRQHKPNYNGCFIIIARPQMKFMSYHDVALDWIRAIEKIEKDYG